MSAFVQTYKNFIRLQNFHFLHTLYFVCYLYLPDLVHLFVLSATKYIVSLFFSVPTTALSVATMPPRPPLGARSFVWLVNGFCFTLSFPITGSDYPFILNMEATSLSKDFVNFLQTSSCHLHIKFTKKLCWKCPDQFIAFGLT
jgi:hypothetical protein